MQQLDDLLGDVVHAFQAVCGVSVSVAVQVVGDVVGQWCDFQFVFDSCECSLLLKGGLLRGHPTPRLQQPLLDAHSLPAVLGLLFPAAMAT